VNTYRSAPSIIFELAIFGGFEPLGITLDFVIRQSVLQIFYHFLCHLGGLGYIDLDLAEFQTAILVADSNVLTALGELFQSGDDSFASLTSFLHNFYFLSFWRLYCVTA
jgi:hypothetical protein